MKQRTMTEMVDLAIIGGGPTGLFAAFYAGLRGMSVKIIDSLEILGGQLTTLYPEKYIYDVAGFPQILAKDLANNLIQQAQQFKPKIALGWRVQDVDRSADGSHVEVTTEDAVHPAKAVIIAAGVGAFEPKTLGVKEAKDFEGKGVAYAVRDLQSLAGKRVLIIGGGDSAIDWVNMLTPIATNVTLIHRRDQFRAHEQSVEKMKQGPCNILTFHELHSIGGSGRVENACIFDNRTKEKKTLDIDHILVNIGFSNSLGPIANWDLEVEGGSIKVDSMMRTNLPGIYAAGDIATYPGKLKLIATGFADACTAVNFAKHDLDPHSAVFPGHSSNMKR